MQRLEASGAVRPLQGSLGDKGLIFLSCLFHNRLRSSHIMSGVLGAEKQLLLSCALVWRPVITDVSNIRRKLLLASARYSLMWRLQGPLKGW